MRIGEIAKRVGIRASAIRYYESIGLLPVATRLSGKRSYGNDTVLTLELIQLAKKLGFTVNEIRDLLRKTGEKKNFWKELVQQKVFQLDQHLIAIQAMRKILKEALKCGCVDLTFCTGVRNFQSGGKIANNSY